MFLSVCLPICLELFFALGASLIDWMCFLRPETFSVAESLPFTVILFSLKWFAARFAVNNFSDPRLLGVITGLAAINLSGKGWWHRKRLATLRAGFINP
jgi:hypothetical protein